MEVSSLARTERTLSCLLFPQHTHLHIPAGQGFGGVGVGSGAAQVGPDLSYRCGVTSCDSSAVIAL